MGNFVELHHGVVGKTTRLEVAQVDSDVEIGDYHVPLVNNQDRKHLWAVLLREALNQGTESRRNGSLGAWVQYSQLIVMLLTLATLVDLVLR
jgi:hypothetical protein